MKIVVLAGGVSTERDVSLSSGKKIYAALKSKGHQVILLDVYLGIEGDVNNLFDKEIDWAGSINDIGEESPDIEQVKTMREDNRYGFFGPNILNLCQEADIVFIALHGENGENGKIQASFDLLDIKYTGTDYLSSALAMDKSLSKELFLYHNIPTAESVTFHKGEEYKDTIGFPKVVKVTCGGSSVGVFIVKDEVEYRNALNEAYQLESNILVEKYIKGREFSVGILDGKALPVIEIAPVEGFYDYKNKYQPGNAIETCPAEISLEKTKELQEVAEKVFHILRLKTYARIDFMMSSEDESIYCLEANTLPGMTPTSLLPQEAAVIGYDYPSLCEKIIEISLEK